MKSRPNWSSRPIYLFLFSAVVCVFNLYHRLLILAYVCNKPRHSPSKFLMQMTQAHGLSSQDGFLGDFGKLTAVGVRVGDRV